MTWLLLIYTVPAEPSRARAAVWREVKRAGAVYLRDGVCALPERESTLATFTAIAAKVEERGGQATLARSVQLDLAKSSFILQQAAEARSAEYADLEREIGAFAAHLRQERAHHIPSYQEIELLEADVAKLRRWLGQIRARDFTERGADLRIERLLNQCESEVVSATEEAYEQEEASK